LIAPEVDHRERLKAGDLLLVSEDGPDRPQGVVWANTSTHVDRYAGALSAPSSSRWYLNQLFVSEPARGHGVGLDLVRGVQAVASTMGCEEIIALVRPDNSASMRLFDRAGGQNVGSLRGLRFGPLGSLRWVTERADSGSRQAS
jgi:RimJ/RimL family protein N-acetyltransferase